MRALFLALATIATCAPASHPTTAVTPMPVATGTAEPAATATPSAKPDYAAAAAFLATKADLDEARQEMKPEMLSAPAVRSFSNVLVLQGSTGEDFIAAMYGMKHGLDRNCLFCHEKDDFPKDTDHKKAARGMLLMTERINRETFGGKIEVTCWTCHRGKEEPEKAPADMAKRMEKAMPKEFVVPPADAKKPAREVFKNMQVLGSVPAGMIPEIMGVFSASLGVGCDFCHVKNDGASDDKKEKRVAREMMILSGRASAQISGKPREVSCWSCHRGSAHPEKAPGAKPEPHHH